MLSIVEQFRYNTYITHSRIIDGIVLCIIILIIHNAIVLACVAIVTFSIRLRLHRICTFLLNKLFTMTTTRRENIIELNSNQSLKVSCSFFFCGWFPISPLRGALICQVKYGSRAVCNSLSSSWYKINAKSQNFSGRRTTFVFYSGRNNYSLPLLR